MDDASTARVLVADGMALTRFAIVTLTKLHPRMEICAEAADGPGARQLCAQEQPDLAIIDLAIPRGNGSELIKDLIRLHPPLLIVIVSEREDALSVQRAFKAGARAFVSKHEEHGELQAALESVLQGELYASRRIVHLLINSLAQRSARKGPPANLPALSDRELNIFRMIAHGRQPTAIAAQLCVSVKTIETHLQRIKQKLSISCAAELRRCAEAWLKNAGR